MLGQLTVLVIDDDKLIRSLTKKILGSADCTTLLADCGEAGLQKLRDQYNEIDLVIIDYTMDDISGFDLLKAIRGLSAEIPAIVSSGNAVNLNDLTAELRCRTSILQKPYRSSDLLQAVESAMAVSLPVG